MKRDECVPSEGSVKGRGESHDIPVDYNELERE